MWKSVLDIKISGETMEGQAVFLMTEKEVP